MDEHCHLLLRKTNDTAPGLFFFFPDSGRHQNEAFDVIFPSEKEMIFFVRINCICLTLIVTSKSTGEIQFYDIERESDVHENEPNYYFF